MAATNRNCADRNDPPGKMLAAGMTDSTPRDVLKSDSKNDERLMLKLSLSIAKDGGEVFENTLWRKKFYIPFCTFKQTKNPLAWDTEDLTAVEEFLKYGINFYIEFLRMFSEKIKEHESVVAVLRRLGDLSRYYFIHVSTCRSNREPAYEYPEQYYYQVLEYVPNYSLVHCNLSEVLFKRDSAKLFAVLHLLAGLFTERDSKLANSKALVLFQSSRKQYDRSKSTAQDKTRGQSTCENFVNCLVSVVSFSVQLINTRCSDPTQTKVTAVCSDLLQLICGSLNATNVRRKAVHEQIYLTICILITALDMEAAEKQQRSLLPSLLAGVLLSVLNQSYSAILNRIERLRGPEACAELGEGIKARIASTKLTASVSEGVVSASADNSNKPKKSRRLMRRRRLPPGVSQMSDEESDSNEAEELSDSDDDSDLEMTGDVPLSDDDSDPDVIVEEDDDDDPDVIVENDDYDPDVIVEDDDDEVAKTREKKQDGKSITAVVEAEDESLPIFSNEELLSLITTVDLAIPAYRYRRQPKKNSVADDYLDSLLETPGNGLLASLSLLVSWLRQKSLVKQTIVWNISKEHESAEEENNAMRHSRLVWASLAMHANILTFDLRKILHQKNAGVLPTLTRFYATHNAQFKDQIAMLSALSDLAFEDDFFLRTRMPSLEVAHLSTSPRVRCLFLAGLVKKFGLEGDIQELELTPQEITLLRVIRVRRDLIELSKLKDCPLQYNSVCNLFEVMHSNGSNSSSFSSQNQSNLPRSLEHNNSSRNHPACNNNTVHCDPASQASQEFVAVSCTTAGVSTAPVSDSYVDRKTTASRVLDTQADTVEQNADSLSTAFDKILSCCNSTSFVSSLIENVSSNAENSPLLDKITNENINFINTGDSLTESSKRDTSANNTVNTEGNIPIAVDFTANPTASSNSTTRGGGHTNADTHVCDSAVSASSTAAACDSNATIDADVDNGLNYLPAVNGPQDLVESYTNVCMFGAIGEPRKIVQETSNIKNAITSVGDAKNSTGTTSISVHEVNVTNGTNGDNGTNACTNDSSKTRSHLAVSSGDNDKAKLQKRETGQLALTQSWLRHEVSNNTNSELAFLVPDTGVFLRHQTLLDKHLKGNHYCLVVAAVVLEELDELKRLLPSARNASRLIDRLQRQDSLVSVQRQGQTLPIPGSSCPPHTDRVARRWYRLLECCYFFARKSYPQENNPASSCPALPDAGLTGKKAVVTLLTTDCEEDLRKLNYPVLELAARVATELQPVQSRRKQSKQSRHNWRSN